MPGILTVGGLTKERVDKAPLCITLYTETARKFDRQNVVESS